MKNQEFADRIKKLRGAIGLNVTQVEFANLLKWNRDRIKRIENGIQKYKPIYLDEITHNLEKSGYKLNAKWFLTGKGDPFLEEIEPTPPSRESTLRQERSAICPNDIFGVYISDDPDRKYCGYCGTGLISQCPHCGADIKHPGQRFCGYCGKPSRNKSAT